jgi:hypothetical protein
MLSIRMPRTTWEFYKPVLPSQFSKEPISTWWSRSRNEIWLRLRFLSLDLRTKVRSMRQSVANDKWSVHRLVYALKPQHALEYSTEGSLFLLVQRWICNFIGRHKAQLLWRNKRTAARPFFLLYASISTLKVIFKIIKKPMLCRF